MIAAARWHQRHVFAHRKEGNDGEQNERANPPDHDGDGEDGAHLPPRADAGVEIVNGSAADAGSVAALQDPADQSGSDEQEQHAAIQPDELRVMEGLKHQAGPIRRRLETASRARSRKASFSSFGSTWRGLPKVSRLSI